VTREELAELLTRRAAASTQLEELAIERAQIDGELERRSSEHRVLRAAVFRTARDFERVMASAEAARAENSRFRLRRALGGHDRRDGHDGRVEVRTAMLVPLRQPRAAELEAPDGARASQG
jgi:SMC interacting uncharacterized protein involved in chromosome segregation